MLKSWSIQNFKPILDSGELEFKPVTILAGRNSSGKSSLIQSILMVAQTLSNPLPERALLPNGPLVQLGSFEDILSTNASFRTLTIGFELDTQTDDPSKPLLQNVKVTFSEDDSGKNISVNVPISVEHINMALRNQMEDFLIPPPDEDLGESEKPASITWVDKVFSYASKANEDQIKKYLKNVTPTATNMRLFSSLSGKNLYLGTLSYDGEDSDLRLMTLSHFFPASFIEKAFSESIPEDRRQSTKQFIADQISRFLESGYDTLGDNQVLGLLNSTDYLSNEIIEHIKGLGKPSALTVPATIRTLKDIASWFRSLRMSNDLKSSFAEYLQVELTDYLFYIAEELLPLDDSSDISYSYTSAVDEITRFFTSQIRYISPLRLDPDRTQRTFAPTSQMDDVGHKGEYAAVVYHYNQSAPIDWYNPDTVQIEEGTLKDALNIWVRYLEVANEVTTEEAGALGVAWKVVIKPGQSSRTLPEIGGGVNHLLPILVMGLLSPKNTLLIIEEPEVTLHPSVQARLGDFFMGLAQCGKQCLIETHSENLVSQLRYHIVQAGGMEKSDCMVYFVDQDERGAAKFEKVEISAKGNILNWPDGFFDETMLQEGRITTASLRKRAKKASND